MGDYVHERVTITSVRLRTTKLYKGLPGVPRASFQELVAEEKPRKVAIMATYYSQAMVRVSAQLALAAQDAIQIHSYIHLAKS